VVAAGLLVRIRVHEWPATLQSAVSVAPLPQSDNRRTHGRNTSRIQRPLAGCAASDADEDGSVDGRGLFVEAGPPTR